MSKQDYIFVDQTGAEERPPTLLAPVVICRAEIDAEIDRLASAQAPANGRRVSLVARPATGVGNGLAPGIAVSICVLNPGERTKPSRRNSFAVDFCIRGDGQAIIDGKQIDFRKFDVWTTPPWSVHEYLNDSDDVQVRLSYSNAPLLEKLQVHIVDEAPNPEHPSLSTEEVAADASRTSPYGTFQLTEDGGYLMPYEQLINPDRIRIKPLHWPWEKVKAELDKLKELGKRYAGRRLYLMYDPATGRTNGTTLSFFATITVRPANIV